MENNNSKKSFNVSEVEIKTGFSPLTIKELVADGVKEVTINAMGRIVVNQGVKLVMWEAPATPAGKLAAQRAILAAGLKMSGWGVLTAALPKPQPSILQRVEKGEFVAPKPETPPAEEPAPAPAPAPKGPKAPRRNSKKTVAVKEVTAE